MNRIRIGISALVVTLGFAACGQEDAPDDPIAQVQSALFSMPPPIAYPAIVNGNKMKVFLRNTHGVGGLTRLDYNGSTWLAPVHMSHPVRGEPAVVSWGPNRMDAFVRGEDDQLWTTFWTGGAWSEFIPLGRFLAGSPTAVSTGVNRLDVVFRNAFGHVGSGFWNGSEWQFGSIPEAVAEKIAAVVVNGTVHIFFVRATDNKVVHAFKTGPTTWSTPVNRSGTLTATDSPSAVAFNDGQIGIFFRRTSGQLAHMLISASGSTSGFSFVDQIRGTPSAVLWNNGTRVNVFVVISSSGLDRLFNYWKDSTGWHGPDLLDSTALGFASPASIAWVSNSFPFPTLRLNVFVKVGDALGSKWWDGSQWRGIDILANGPF